jgi:3-deoxy-D-manno-octulosonic acid kinase
MFKNIPIPPSFSLIQRGQVFLLLRDQYQELLLKDGIEDMETYLSRRKQEARTVTGRRAHPSVLIEGGERMIVRHYSHGGLLGSLTRDLYWRGSRSFRELALTEEIRSCGIPTVCSIGAIHQRAFPFFYRAYLLTREVPRARNLIEYLSEAGFPAHGDPLSLKRMILRNAGLMLRRFHDAGFFHADLQLKNIMVVDAETKLIDFDRSYRKQSLSQKERMKNLLRLNRSADKWKRKGLPVTRTDRWRFFMAYAGRDEEVRKALRKALRHYSMRLLFHRIFWTMGGDKGSRSQGFQGSRVRGS